MSDNTSGQTRELRLDVARNRVNTILTLAYVTGAAVSPAEVRQAALTGISPTAVQAATLLANLILMNVEGLALTLASLADDAALEALLAGLQPCLTPDEVAGAWLFGDLIAPTPRPVITSAASALRSVGRSLGVVVRAFVDAGRHSDVSVAPQLSGLETMRQALTAQEVLNSARRFWYITAGMKS